MRITALSDQTSNSNKQEESKKEESKKEESKKVPHDPDEINPKLSSDIHYWAEEFHVTGQQLHEAIRVHGTHVKKVREALKSHKA